MLLYTVYIVVSLIYFSYTKTIVGETIQCFFWDAIIDLTYHHENLLRDKACQLLCIKVVAQIIMCIAGVSPQIPITVSCCAYVFCAVEYLNWRCCDPLFVVGY